MQHKLNDQHSISGSRSHSRAGGQDLEDVRDECAWRMGQWGAPATEWGAQLRGSTHSEGVRFNQAVVGCLRALASGDDSSYQALLASARRVGYLQACGRRDPPCALCPVPCVLCPVPYASALCPVPCAS